MPAFGFIICPSMADEATTGIAGPQLYETEVSRYRHAALVTLGICGDPVVGKAPMLLLQATATMQSTCPNGL